MKNFYEQLIDQCYNGTLIYKLVLFLECGIREKSINIENLKEEQLNILLTKINKSLNLKTTPILNDIVLSNSLNNILINYFEKKNINKNTISKETWSLIFKLGLLKTIDYLDLKNNEFEEIGLIETIKYGHVNDFLANNKNCEKILEECGYKLYNEEFSTYVLKNLKNKHELFFDDKSGQCTP